MRDFIFHNWSTVLVLIVGAAYAGYLVANKRWDELRAVAYRLILQAEKTITGTKRGKEKFEFVLSKLYSLIPGWMQFFVSEDDLRLQLQEWYDDIKDYLDNGKIDQSV